MLRAVPERRGHRLGIQWSVPPEQRAWRSAPCGFVSHLIGCEGNTNLCNSANMERGNLVGFGTGAAVGHDSGCQGVPGSDCSGRTQGKVCCEKCVSAEADLQPFLFIVTSTHLFSLLACEGRCSILQA